MTATFSRVSSLRERIAVIRKQVDRQMLRMQGRMDGPNVDRFVPWILAALMFAVLFALALARSRSIDMGRDLAVYMQSTWLLAEGFKPESTITGTNIFAEQASFIMYPISLLVSFLPRVTTLLGLQSFALAVAIVPLWRLARGLGSLRVGTTSALVFAYFVNATVHYSNVSGFHPAVFALPALMAAVRYGLEGRRRHYIAMILLVLSCRADLGLAVAGLGLLLAIEGRRREGIATMSIGIGWLIMAIFVIQPSFAGGLFPYVDAFGSFGSSPLEILWGILRAPHEFLRLIVSKDNFLIVVTLLAPVLFLPLVAPRYLMPAIPLYAVYLAADVPAGLLAESAQTVPITAFVFVATVFALKRSGRVLVERVNVDRRVVWALVLTAVVFFIRDAPSSPYESPWNFGRIGAVETALIDAADLVPDGAPVRASGRALPLLAERFAVFELDTTGTEVNVDAAIDQVDWIVFDSFAARNWDNLTTSTFISRLGLRGFEKIYETEGVSVFKFTGVVQGT